jgi:hypothetical protein
MTGSSCPFLSQCFISDLYILQKLFLDTQLLVSWLSSQSFHVLLMSARFEYDLRSQSLILSAREWGTHSFLALWSTHCFVAHFLCPYKTTTCSSSATYFSSHWSWSCKTTNDFLIARSNSPFPIFNIISAFNTIDWLFNVFFRWFPEYQSLHVSLSLLITYCSDSFFFFWWWGSHLGPHTC